mgnify:CR=1 FL=1
MSNKSATARHSLTKRCSLQTGTRVRRATVGSCAKKRPMLKADGDPALSITTSRPEARASPLSRATGTSQWTNVRTICNHLRSKVCSFI